MGACRGSEAGCPGRAGGRGHAQSGLSGWPDRVAGPLDHRSEPRRCFAALLPGLARSAQLHAARARGQQPQPAPVRPRRAAQHVPGHLPPRHPPRHRARATGHRRHLDPDGGSDAGRDDVGAPDQAERVGLPRDGRRPAHHHVARAAPEGAGALQADRQRGHFRRRGAAAATGGDAGRALRWRSLRSAESDLAGWDGGAGERPEGSDASCPAVSTAG